MKENMKSAWLALDIDDTLANTAHDWFQELKKLFGDPWFNFDELHKHNNYNRVNEVWSDPDAQQRMMTKIHDNNYQTNISLVPHALESVQDIHTHKPFSCYITMRPQNVIEWTKEWLLKHWFPELRIIARPLSISKEKEHSRKVWVLNELYQEWVAGIIDDQIKLIHQMEEYYPDYPGTIHIIWQSKAYKALSTILFQILEQY